MIEQKIKNEVLNAIGQLYGKSIDEAKIQLQKTRKDFEGDITLVVFPLAGIIRKSPEEGANEIGNFLLSNVEEITAFNVVKGFLNLAISTEYWLNNFNESLKEKNFGFAQPGSKPEIMVEYSSPNTNKPLHLGHLRNNFLGFSVAEILKADGHKVDKVQIINDRGIHICKSMVAWQKFGHGKTPENSGLKGDKLVGNYYVEFDKVYKKQIAELVAAGMGEEQAAKEAPILTEARDMLLKWEQKDPEIIDLWEKMNGWVYEGFNITYKTMGVDFDKLYYESETYLVGKNEVLKGLEKGIFFQKDDGSVWVDLTGRGLDQKLLLRADGTSVYMTQDIGTAILRFKDFPELKGIVYTVGNEQEYHFKVLFIILEKLGFAWAKNCSHLSYGMVDLPSGKMKSREGTVVDADDLMEEMRQTAAKITSELGKLEGMNKEEQESLFHSIGQASLKYFLLKVDPMKRMMFNPEESIDFNGNTGPFIQYTHARIQSVLRKYGREITEINSDLSISGIEMEIVQSVLEFNNIIHEASESLSPALIANYVFDLVKSFNNFYQTTPILKVENEGLLRFRIALSAMVAKVIKSGMGLLGIAVPDKM